MGKTDVRLVFPKGQIKIIRCHYIAMGRWKIAAFKGMSGEGSG
jgi:hypothetical protein